MSSDNILQIQQTFTTLFSTINAKSLFIKAYKFIFCLDLERRWGERYWLRCSWETENQTIKWIHQGFWMLLYVLCGIYHLDFSELKWVSLPATTLPNSLLLYHPTPGNLLGCDMLKTSPVIGSVSYLDSKYFLKSSPPENAPLRQISSRDYRKRFAFSQDTNVRKL